MRSVIDYHGGDSHDHAPAKNQNRPDSDRAKERKNMTLKLNLMGAAGAAAMIAASAHAQGAPASTAPTIAEIVVTAEHRAENVQKIPLSVTAVGGDNLAKAGIVNADGLSNLVPSLHIATDAGGSTQITIRGIGSTGVTEEGDPAAAFHIDGVYLARAQSFSTAFYDIDRVEVLRGPQGTLYGRNATAGSIDVITKKPVDRYEGEAAVEVGNYSAVNTFGVINVPVASDLAVRAAFQTQRHAGYANNAPHTNGQDADNQAGRIQTLWKPTDNFSWLIGVDYEHQGGVGGGFRGGERGLPLTSTPYTYPVTIDGHINHVDDGIMSQIDWNFGFAKLTYIAAYRRETQDDLNQVSRTGLTLDGHFKQHQMSHEVRIAHDTERLKWVVGAYYFDETGSAHLEVPLGGPVLVFSKPDAVDSSKAVFGQATYSVMDNLRLTGGVRTTQDHKATIGGLTFIRNVDGSKTTVSVNEEGGYFGDTNWKVGIDYDLTPRSLLYMSAGTGYKAGGYFDGGVPNTYLPEHLFAIEVGSKNRFFNNRAQINVSAYHYDYRDFQVGSARLLGGQPSSITVNAQRATIYGVELESIFLITQNDRIDLSGDYGHGRYDKFVLPGGDVFSNAAAPAGTLIPANYTGNALAHMPEWTLTAGYTHTWTMSNDGKIDAHIETHYEAGQNLDYHDFAITKIGAFTRTDINLTYTSPDRKWSVAAYGRNLENKAVLILAVPAALGANKQTGDGSLAPPRTYGVRLSAKF
jgi:iron complex outermembrane receptor protein